jgi:hypothetical protein
MFTKLFGLEMIAASSDESDGVAVVSMSSDEFP